MWKELIEKNYNKVFEEISKAITEADNTKNVYHVEIDQDGEVYTCTYSNSNNQSEDSFLGRAKIVAVINGWDCTDEFGAGDFVAFLKEKGVEADEDDVWEVGEPYINEYRQEILDNKDCDIADEARDLIEKFLREIE